MAFQQPTRQAIPRAPRPATVDEPDATIRPTSSPERQPEVCQSWVLFSPPTDVTTTSYLSETERSLDTPGRSQLSDLGSSLNTVARSALHADATQPPLSLSAIHDAALEDDAELDSLDSHLPDFRSLPGAPQEAPQRGGQHALPVLPTHDGLGSFRLSRPGLGRDAQDQIYQFERFNPRRVRRRLDSFDKTQLELVHGFAQEEDKRQRIEAWRLDHSRVLVDEVQRETRRRRKSQASMQRFQYPGDVDSENTTWHDGIDHVQSEEEDQGFLARITRTVVRDLLGIDEDLLSALLGESLAEDGMRSTTPRASQPGGQPLVGSVQAQAPSWHLHLLERLSRELGLLVSQLSSHPGAFSTYTRMQQMPLPYAGLPVIPESIDALETTEAKRANQPSAPRFEPTMQQQSQPMSIPRRRTADVSDGAKDDADTDKTFTQEEWERDLDVKVVFRYLISRFSSRSKSPSSASTCHGSTPAAQDSAAKMTRVRQHHPLIGRSRPTERRGFKATAALSSPVAGRHHSSCASQSTRRSARRSSGSSRHYWDIGGSLGTGSVIASHGPMGSWGEV